MVGQLAAEYPRLPILTVSSDSQALLQSLQRGAKHFLTHPVTLEDLLAALRRSLSEAPSSRDRAGGPRMPAGAEDGRPDHQRPRLPRRGRVHEPRRQPGRDPGRRPGQLGRPDRPRPGAGRRGHRPRTAGQRQHQHGRPGAEHRAAGHELPEAGAGQAPGDRAVDPAPPAGDRRNRRHPRRPRGTHSELAQDQLHAPGPRPEQGAAADRPDGPADEPT